MAIPEHDGMRYAQNITELIGDTPLVRLNRVVGDIAATVLVKVEYLNPGASSKDRIAERIIDAAEREGLLKPGGTIVEPTSGNTGVGLALVAQQRGYRCVFVLPDKVGVDKRNVLTAYGAEIVVTPTAVPPEHPESYYNVSDRLAREIPGAYKPNQYENQNGPRSHYETTGPEIWRDTAGRVTHFVAGVGTGGTITGTGRFLREASADRASGRVRVIGADPVGSVYSGGTGRPYLVEGVGEDFWPGAYDPKVVDDVIAVSDAESFDMTVRLAREEGLLVGGSSGMAVVAALKAARELSSDDVVVVLLPDGGRGYLGKIFNDGWMRAHGFANAAGEQTVARLVASAASAPEKLPHVGRETTVRDALSVFSVTGLNALPVLSGDVPPVLGEVSGAVRLVALLDHVASGEASLDAPAAAFASGPLPLVGAGESISAARLALDDSDPLLVIAEGLPVALLSRQSLLKYLSA